MRHLTKETQDENELGNLFLLKRFPHMLGAFAVRPQSDNRLQFTLAYVAIKERLLCCSLVLCTIPGN